MFLLFLLIQANEPKAPLHSERIEAKVGAEIITSSDVSNMLKTLGALSRGEPETALKKRALDSLIERALIRTYLSKMGGSISAKEIDQRINSIRSQNGIASQDEFKAMIAAQGLSFDQFREQVQYQLEHMQFVNFMRRQSQRTIEEKDLKDFYQKNKSQYSNNYEVELQECVLPFGQAPQEIEALAESFRKKPETFGTCVKKYSQSPSKSADGMLGKFQSGILREDVERQVFALEKNQVAIIQQQGALQLLKVKTKSPLGPQSFESVKERIREKLEGDIIQREIEKTMADLRATTFIQI